MRRLIACKTSRTDPMRTRIVLLLTVLSVAGGCGFFNSDAARLAAAERLLAAGDYGAAAVALRNIVQKDPADGHAQLLLAQVQYMRGEDAAAQSALSEAAKHGADPIGVAELKAQLAINANKLTEMLADLSGGKIALPPAKADLYRARGLQGMGLVVDALAIYERLLQADPNNADLHVYAAECHLLLGRAPLAQQEIDQALVARPDSAAAWAVRARLLEATNAAGSRQALGKAIEHGPGQLRLGEEVSLLSREIGNLLAADDVKAAGNEYKKLIALAPQAAITEWIGSQIALVKGDTSAAVATLQRMLQHSPNLITVRPALIAALLTADNYELALHEMSGLVGNTPSDPRVKNLQEALKKVASAPAGSVEKAVGATVIATSLDQLIAAHQIIEAAAKAHPESPAIAAAAIQLQLRLGQNAAALERARALQARYDKDEGALITLAAAQIANNDLSAAKGSYEALWKNHPSAGVALALSQLKLRTGDNDATALLEEWVGKHPKDPGVRMTLAQVLQDQGQLDKAITQYEQILAQQPQDVIALNNLAWVYYLKKDARALSTAKQAYDRATANPLVADTYAWILAESGNREAALPILRNAARLAPGRAAVRYHLAAVLARSTSGDDVKVARLYLSDLLRDPAPAEWRADAERLLGTLPSV
jgi:tetratricopeptide (TPR) repeat protein